MKIAEETPPPKREGLGRALRSMAVAAGGSAVGYGAAELAARKMKFFNPATATSPEMANNRVRMARIILPILSGASVMLADRYRQRLNEEYRKTRGYKNGK